MKHFELDSKGKSLDRLDRRTHGNTHCGIKNFKYDFMSYSGT